MGRMQRLSGKGAARDGLHVHRGVGMEQPHKRAAYVSCAMKKSYGWHGMVG